LIVREPAAARLAVKPEDRLLWDGRCRIALGRHIGAAALGPPGRVILRASRGFNCSDHTQV